MQTRDFCFWLQGLLEVGKIETLDAQQVQSIKDHLGLVFQHDPTITGVEHGAAEKAAVQDMTGIVRSILQKPEDTHTPRSRWENPRTVLLC
jgi:hypothetical protein